MKLPDFTIFSPFLEAKRRMGISPSAIGNLESVEVTFSGPTYKELKDLKGQGVDVELDEVLENEDGTLRYKNKRVILYIRDVAGYSKNYGDPRFHVSNCRTIQEMRSNNRFGRYVVANRDDGLFSVNVGESRKSADKKLQVCQNCLDYLSYDGFELQWEQHTRQRTVGQFKISRFFEIYPRSLHYEIPSYNSANAPRNSYSNNFSEISKSYRESVDWKCEGLFCGVNLNASEHRKFLHVHHQDGQKNNNSRQNLKALCLNCHANEFQHQHMRSLPEYEDFLAIRKMLLKYQG
jgi:hypothetical protein